MYIFLSGFYANKYTILNLCNLFCDTSLIINKISTSDSNGKKKNNYLLNTKNNEYIYINIYTYNKKAVYNELCGRRTMSTNKTRAY